MKKILLATLLAFTFLPLPAESQLDRTQLTQAQVQGFRNLPPAEQERLLRSMGVTLPDGLRDIGNGLPRDAVQDPRAGERRQVLRNGLDDQDDQMEPRIKTGDTLVIHIEPIPADAAAAENALPRVELPTILRGRRLAEVSATGAISLPIIGGIRVIGLTAGQAAERIRAEAIFADSSIHVLLLPVEPTGRRTLQPFGYELFRQADTTFAPTAAVPVPRDYVLGPGDIVNVQLFGQQAGFYGLEVTREGQLMFPHLGPINVSGMSFAAAQALILQRVEEQMIGVRASVTMGPLRTMRVFVLGDAEKPGAYTMSALATTSHALYVSGGIANTGSLRLIEIKRGGETIALLDVYDLLLRGDTRNDVRLQADDVVFIPPAGTQVSIDGEVRRPAIYELRNERSVGEVLQLAGGTLSNAFPSLTRIERIQHENGEREVVTVNSAEEAGRRTRIRDGDYLTVPSILDRIDGVVRLTGHVHRAVAREFKAGMRISDLVPDIRVLRDQADLRYAVLQREVGPTRMVEVTSVSLDLMLADPQGPHDLELRANDELIIFGVHEIEVRRVRVQRILTHLTAQATAGDPYRGVQVSGHVRAEGQYPLESGMRVLDLIRAGGGLAESAFALEAEITRRGIIDGDEQRIEHFTVDLQRVLAGDPQANVQLDSRDTLTIKRKPRWADDQTIDIRGEVRFPGIYTFRDEESLGDVIRRAGGLTEFAYPAGAVFMRSELRRREQQQVDLMIERLEMDIATSRIGERGELSQQVGAAQALAGQLRRTRAAGRLVINLERAMLDHGDLRFDIKLMNDDTLVVPRQPQSVTIIGEVHYPTSHFWESGLRLNDFTERSGGITSRADRKSIYLVRASGAVIPAGGRRAPEILPGDTIVVPLDADRIPRLTFWTSISQIFYQIGIAAAAWQSVGVF